MPPKVRFQREDIISVTCKIVQEDGMEAVNARRVAKELGCSVQPIFHKFENMEDLKQEVVKRIYELYQSYMKTGSEEERAYRGMGLAYIRFAKEYPKFFQVLFMGNSKLSPSDFIEKDDLGNHVLEKGAEFTGYDADAQKSFHMKVWVFTHGIACMVATGTVDFQWEDIERLLTDTVRQIKIGEIHDKK